MSSDVHQHTCFEKCRKPAHEPELLGVGLYHEPPSSHDVMKELPSWRQQFCVGNGIICPKIG